MTTFELADRGGAKMYNMMDIDGVRLNTFGNEPEVQENIIKNLKNFKILDDDVILCSAVKSGTHWGFEIVSMLMAGKAERVSFPKGARMIEAIPEGQVPAEPSPRLLNSHMSFHRLPKGILEKRIKILLFLRNFKDTAVSFYHFSKGLKVKNYNGEFHDFLPLFIEGQLEYGDWFEYVLEFEKAMESQPIHLVYYEDMKQNGIEEIRKIGEFLDTPVDDDLIKAIHDKCDFKQMAREQDYTGELRDKFFQKGYTLYRKGEVGDWKNYWTVAESEAFDQLYNEKMKNSKLSFTYETKATK